MSESSEPTHVVGYLLTFADGTSLHDPVEIGTEAECREIMRRLPAWDWPVEGSTVREYEFFLLTVEEFELVQQDLAA